MTKAEMDDLNSRIEKRAKDMHCTMCGKQYDFFDAQENFRIDQYVGYGSKYDEDHIIMNLCCDCFDRLMDFAIPLCKEDPIVNRKNN